METPKWGSSTGCTAWQSWVSAELKSLPGNPCVGVVYLVFPIQIFAAHLCISRSFAAVLLLARSWRCWNMMYMFESVFDFSACRPQHRHHHWFTITYHYYIKPSRIGQSLLSLHWIRYTVADNQSQQIYMPIYWDRSGFFGTPKTIGIDRKRVDL